MVPLVLFMFSVAALGQFLLYYWRSMVAGVAAQPLSDRVRNLAGLAERVSPTDFQALVNLHQLTPDLKYDRGGLRVLRIHYAVAQALGRFGGARLQCLAAWADREMTTCSRFVAVLIDQRLERNLACASQIRSC